MDIANQVGVLVARAGSGPVECPRHSPAGPERRGRSGGTAHRRAPQPAIAGAAGCGGGHLGRRRHAVSLSPFFLPCYFVL